MNFIYPFFIAFAMVFVSELGDKTQLLVLSFSGKDKTYKILLGVAIFLVMVWLFYLVAILDF